MTNIERKILLREKGHWILLGLGAILFLVGYKIHSEIFYHLAGAVTGAWIIFYVFEIFGLDDMKDSLYKTSVTLNKQPAKDIAKWLFLTAEDAVNVLENPGPLNVYKTHLDYTQALLTSVAKFQSGDQIRAACGKKDWEKINIWFKKNMELADKGIVITRIFLEDSDFTNHKEKIKSIMDEQSEKFTVKFVNYNKLTEHRKLKNLRDGFGFVIFNNNFVLVHNNIGSDDALRFDNPMIIEEFIRTFNELNSDVMSEVHTRACPASIFN